MKNNVYRFYKVFDARHIVSGPAEPNSTSNTQEYIYQGIVHLCFPGTWSEKFSVVAAKTEHPRICPSQYLNH